MPYSRSLWAHHSLYLSVHMPTPTPHIPLLILSLITWVYFLIPVGSFARSLTSVSHTVTFGMELEYYGKAEILIFVSFPLSSAMERQLHFISIQTLKQHVQSKMPVDTSFQNLTL